MAAYTAISAYAGMTESNKDWAIRAVCEGANEILKSGAGAGNAKDSTTTSTSTTAAAAAAAAAVGSNITGHEKLARAQALFLIQTVRCFDGDIALRAQAERDMGVLEKWLKDLEGLRDNFDEVHLLDDGALRGRPPRSWEVWIFNECVRRTVLMGYVFTSMYQMLKSAGDFGEAFIFFSSPCPPTAIALLTMSRSRLGTVADTAPLDLLEAPLGRSVFADLLHCVAREAHVPGQQFLCARRRQDNAAGGCGRFREDVPHHVSIVPIASRCLSGGEGYEIVMGG